jgi:hypothetical protein
MSPELPPKQTRSRSDRLARIQRPVSNRRFFRNSLHLMRTKIDQPTTRPLVIIAAIALAAIPTLAGPAITAEALQYIRIGGLTDLCFANRRLSPALSESAPYANWPDADRPRPPSNVRFIFDFTFTRDTNPQSVESFATLSSATTTPIPPLSTLDSPTTVLGPCRSLTRIRLMD